VIGVIAKPSQLEAVEEFFQLFKTPWEFYRPEAAYSVVLATADVACLNCNLLLLFGSERKSIDRDLGIAPGRRSDSVVSEWRDTPLPIYTGVCNLSPSGNAFVTAGGEAIGVRIQHGRSTVIRLGYDLFEEVSWLLMNSQPLEHAHTPALDLHIDLIRSSILSAGLPLMEIPPAPAGHPFAACLTHDIDFVGIRPHKFDHTMFGFLYRATVGVVSNVLRGRLSVRRLLDAWCAVAKLPFVYLGWVEDFWEPFEWYLKAEEGLPATYFLIPFKRRAGEAVAVPHVSRRATAYDVTDIRSSMARLREHGCEIGVHGIDSWHSIERGRAELGRVAETARQSSTGIRMHWLLQDGSTASVLEEAGYAYDSTAGYNETIGYHNGTGQVFRPLGARTLLELPMHIQDGALFFPGQMNLSADEAEQRCRCFIENAVRFGGVLTLLWHDRSHAPERFWGDFYLRLLEQVRAPKPWFGSAAQVVDWFRKRRDVSFERIDISDGFSSHLQYEGVEIKPPLCVRMYRSGRGTPGEAVSDFVDIPWNGMSLEGLERQLPSFFANAVANPIIS